MSEAAPAQNDRLRLAREALARAEAAADMKVSDSTDLSQNNERRSAYHLEGTIEALLEALAWGVKPGQYLAVVGVSDVAWEKAAELGVDLSRVVIIRSPGQHAAKVVGNLVEGFSLVVVGEVEIAPRFQRALAARARKLGTVIWTMRPWVGVTFPLSALTDSANPLLRYSRRAS